MPFSNEVKKVKAKYKGKLAPFFVNKKPSKTPLVMTLLVRNEEDIVAANIEHHFSQGVDFIVATDNNSTDKTRDILSVYEKQGRLHIIDEPSLDYAQSIWVNRMGDWAFAKFGECFLFHVDADEFWFSRSDDLKTELSMYPLLDCLNVDIKNVILLFNDFKEKFPEDACLSIDNPYPEVDLVEQSKDTSFYLFPYPTKIFYRVKNQAPPVAMGNHELLNKKTFSTTLSKDIYVYHFPVRSYEQFEKKVVEGGSALVSNPNLAEGFGWHWRRWYKAYQEGTLKEAYQQLLPNIDEAKKLEEKGVLSIDTSIPKLNAFIDVEPKVANAAVNHV